MKNYTKCNMSNTERKWHKKTWLVYWSACYIFDSMLFKTHVSRYFWIRNLSFPDTASVHMHPVNPAYESATFWIRSPEWKFLNTLWIRNRVDANIFYPATWQDRAEFFTVNTVFCIQDGNLFTRLSLLPVEGEVGEDPGNEVVHDGCRLVTHALLSIFPEVSWVLE